MSKFRIEILTPLEYFEWNSFVDRSPQGDMFCYSWWLDAITKSNFSIIVAIEKNEIVAGIPLAYDAQKKVNEPPLTRTLGVLYKSQINLSEYKQVSNQRRWLTALLEHIPMEDFIQMCMHHNFKDWLPFRWKGFKQITRYTYLIHYQNHSVDDLWKNLNQGRKNSIIRAINNNVKVEETDDFELLYQYCGLSYERQGLKFRTPLKDLHALDLSIKNYGHRLILKAIDDENQVHALSYVAFNNRSAYYLLSGSDKKYRQTGSHTLLLWETIKYFRDKVEYFNFGGSDIEHIEEHVRGFGGTLTPYFHIYNEKLMGRSYGIRYHLKEIKFHSEELLKSLKSKLF